jgi:hypothetical protein
MLAHKNRIKQQTAAPGLKRSPTCLVEIEAPCSKLQGMFCLAAVLRSDCKEYYNFWIRSLTPQPAKHCRQAEPTGKALAVAVQL